MYIFSDFLFFFLFPRVMFPLVLFAFLVVAGNAQLHPRQAAAVSSAATSPVGSVSVSASASAPLSSATPNASLSNPPTFPISIPSTNPTAVPLTSLVVTAASQATVPLDTTYAAGAVPTAIGGAPPLPDSQYPFTLLSILLIHSTVSAINPANYPPLDKPPPTDSSLVQSWIAEVRHTPRLTCPPTHTIQVNSSGITIPNIDPTAVGGCPTNPAAVADTSRCWWTCNQCTRSTDIITCPDKLTWGSR